MCRCAKEFIGTVRSDYKNIKRRGVTLSLKEYGNYYSQQNMLHHEMICLIGHKDGRYLRCEELLNMYSMVENAPEHVNNIFSKTNLTQNDWMKIRGKVSRITFLMNTYYHYQFKDNTPENRFVSEVIFNEARTFQKELYSIIETANIAAEKREEERLAADALKKQEAIVAAEQAKLDNLKRHITINIENLHIHQ